MEMPKIGDMLKVQLRGETPWAEIIELHDDGFTGRIANKLFEEYSQFEKAMFLNMHFDDVKKLKKLHDFKENDVVRFKKILHDGYIMLVPEIDLDYYRGLQNGNT